MAETRIEWTDAGVPLFIKQAELDGKLVKMPTMWGQVWDQYPEVKL